MSKSVGYHERKIKKGKFGEISKIVEETEELVDANEQGIEIMVLCELSDLVGAIEGYMDRYYPNMCLDDLIMMAHATKRAFINGHRT